MKHLFLLICIAFSLTASAQLRTANGEIGPDTLSASETVYHYIGGTSWATATQFNGPGELVVLIQSDSLTGATAATITLEYCLDDACALTYTAGTLTCNGAASQQLRVEDLNFIERKVRVKAVATSGVQTTKFQTAYSFKRRD